MWYRVLFSIAYLSLAVLSVQYLFIRRSIGKLNHIHLKVLVLNLITSLIYGVVCVLGGDMITTNVSQEVHLFLYSMLLGYMLASDIWLSSLYGSLAETNDSRTRPRWKRFRGEYVAYLGIIFDVVVGFSLSYGTAGTKRVVSIALGLTLIPGQIGVTKFNKPPGWWKKYKRWKSKIKGQHCWYWKISCEYMLNVDCMLDSNTSSANDTYGIRWWQGFVEFFVWDFWCICRKLCLLQAKYLRVNLFLLI